MPINAPPLDWGALAPVLAVLTGAGIALLLDLFLPPGRRSFLGYFSFGTTLVAIALCLPLWRENAPRLAFSDMINVDRFALFFSLVTLVATALSILLAIDYLEQQEIHWGEYYPLVLFTASGMLLLGLANDLVFLFIALEVLSIGLYILSGIARGRAVSQESAIKYFLLGSFSFGFLVYGTALIYGATGTTNFTALGEALATGNAVDNPLLLVGLALILVGFAFKLALAPFHMWTPDVYSGAPTTVTAFMSVGTKVTTFGALVRMIFSGMPALGNEWANTLFALAIVTMIVGNLAAITQRNIKRMLAYSSIGQAGYVLVAVVAAETQRRDVSDAALNGVLFYLLAYTFMNLGAFAVVIALARPGDERLDLDRDYSGLAWRHPWLAGALALFMLSLGGIPPTAGFIGKLLVFRAAIEAGYWTLALVGVLTSVIALGFYLRVVIRMYTGAPARDDRAPLRLPVPLAATLALCAVLTIGLGVLPAVPLDFAQQALTIVRP